MRVQKLVTMWVGLLAAVCMTASVVAQIPTPEVTKEHKLLKKDVGVWDAEMKIWMQGPDGEPMVSKGVERNRSVGDLWVISDYQGDLGDQTFRGHGQFGYDPIKKKFVGTWIDSMTPHISTMEGTYDEQSGEMTMIATGIDPATGEESKSKSVSKYPDDNTRIFTMFMKAPGGGDDWVKSMEINYKRRPNQGRKKR